MKTCDNCGKKISSFEAYKKDGKILCMDCALGGSYKKEKPQYQSSEKSCVNNKTEDISYKSTMLKLKSTNGWAFGMKILVLILLVVLIIASLALAILVALKEDNFFLGLGIFAALFVLSFSIVGFAMTFLQIAEDISYIKNFLSREHKKDNDI
jgi:hypothetical protein